MEEAWIQAEIAAVDAEVHQGILEEVAEGLLVEEACSFPSEEVRFQEALAGVAADLWGAEGLRGSLELVEVAS